MNAESVLLERAMKTLSLKLPVHLSVKLERAAKQRGQSKSEIVRSALEQFLKGERPMSALELAGDLVGCAAGPADLSTNPKYMEGYGK
jgi:predicted DNA-binding protein